ncbi:putative lipase ROG1 [Ceratocystis fimbriata CBS 114723]|uniref:Putative lipase ROG1 n=1 Tax=Ceratocystis fimbriata CBS 114723 TaxID=1035309 RepID=A0A2C5X9I1_9PEZI|nr:putative lipase ROG1 [Ceratocystis fimbriata CBS 114723]
MLLLLQSGSVKLGDVVRYTITYTPSQDRILPSPEKLYLRIRNTSTIALRAAFVHGPYSLSVSAYPATFDPYTKFANARQYGVPQFEPMVKAGGSWECELTVPENIRQTAGMGHHPANDMSGTDVFNESVTWIVEVASQVLFSTSASVGYEVILGREKKSLNLSYATAPHIPGWSDVGKDRMRLAEELREEEGKPPVAVVATPAITIATNTPIATTAEPGTAPPTMNSSHKEPLPSMTTNKRKKKKIHLVILTHGLHSNLGADMLFLKESIDAAAKKARADAKVRKAQERQARQSRVNVEHSTNTRDPALAGCDGESIKMNLQDGDVKRPSPMQYNNKPAEQLQSEVPGERVASQVNANIKADDKINGNPSTSGHIKNGTDEPDEEEDDDEEVVVKGYSGNATRTERGIKYLGKRLARYVLALTYPDQPYHPIISRGAGESLANAFKGNREHKTDKGGSPKSEKGSPKSDKGSLKAKNTMSSKSAATELLSNHALPEMDLPYKITSISFLGHSLGGLIQTYAVAYIQKHSPRFFDLIRPINFVALATPFLGLSNENPMYVKFALDFGLVGRTGQDLGLTWRPPTLARSGWSAIVSNLGETAHKRVLGESQPESKPLLRILPTGPAHIALRKFRNRTVYSNVVNDGIVPLRTSCLLFLDWQGLGRVEKARRDAGLVETVVALGWAELTGTSMNHRRSLLPPPEDEDNDKETTSTKTDEGSRSDRNDAKSVDGAPLTPLLGEQDKQHEVPQPSNQAIMEDGQQSMQTVHSPSSHEPQTQALDVAATGLSSPFSGLFALFRSGEHNKPHAPSSKQKLIYHRSQTVPMGEETSSGADSTTSTTGSPGPGHIQSRVTTGAEFEGDDGLSAPPRTTVFESAHDLINPKMPDVPHLIDPGKRSRTIFHDRVYHPEDIPLPPIKRRHTKRKSLPHCGLSPNKKGENAPSSPRLASATTVRATAPPSANGSGRLSEVTNVSVPVAKDSKEKSPQKAEPKTAKDPPEFDLSHMRVEEKIARAYHRDLSWRKVLVKLEPDAHNNIIVRRMFPNAYGWPVIQHLVETHFSDSASARLSDDCENSKERAINLHMPPAKNGIETNKYDTPVSTSSGSSSPDFQLHHPRSTHPQPRLNIKTSGLYRSATETAEASDSVSALPPLNKTNRHSRQDSLPTSPSSATTSSFISTTTADNSGTGAAVWDHRDSMTWSDRDWHDSEPDSETGYLSPLSPSSPLNVHAPAVDFPPSSGAGMRAEVLPKNARSATSVESQNQLVAQSQSQVNGKARTNHDASWSWTEAIVGKRHAKSVDGRKVS